MHELSELQESILQYIRDNSGCDGIDVATVLRISADVAYTEIDALIRLGYVRKEYVGLGRGLHATSYPPTQQSFHWI